MNELEITRRRLLATASAGVLGASALAQAAEALAAAAERLPRAAADPFGDAVRATMAAFADTIVPGPAGGADAEPGAIEARVLDEIYNPFYGASGTFGILHADVQLNTPRILGRAASFSLELPYADRQKVLDERMTGNPQGGDSAYPLLYTAAGILVYVCYYGFGATDTGLKVIGFPPRSDGYFPHHTYGVAFETATTTSNPG